MTLYQMEEQIELINQLNGSFKTICRTITVHI